ncbi:MAG: DNA polymerase I [bacterium ADurb.Bin212]|nr:MAG: DNA polymerase I [bacterium ADurb.Bin212]
MNKLVLIDGNAIIHRAYHSMPKTLSTRKGEQTNAIYGFAITLIKVLEDLKPQYLAATFDLAGPTFRHEVFEEYKATRVKADQELYDQIPRVKQLVETMGIPIYEKDGFEADDVIGTIVEIIQKSKIKNQKYNSKVKNKKFISSETKEPNTLAIEQFNNLTIYIVSGDKDIFQLINGNVKVYNLKKGLSQTQIVDTEVIQNEYNLQPSDFIDLKALAGDPSDNIPGVPGIGPKTATELIQRFDTLEKIYENITKLLNCPIADLNNLTIQQFNNETIEVVAKELGLKPRVVKLLIDNKEQAFLSQHLATIHKDVPIDFDLDKCKWGMYDKSKLSQLFEELGFQSLLRRFANNATEEQKKQEQRSEAQKKDEQLKLL